MLIINVKNVKVKLQWKFVIPKDELQFREGFKDYHLGVQA